jgi:hypothetical protein
LDDEGRTLLASFEALRAEECAAAKRISSPAQSMLYPAYMKMVEALEDLRFRCSAARVAFRTHCQNMRDKQK